MHWPSVSNVGKRKVFCRPPKWFPWSKQHKMRWVEHFCRWLNPSRGAPAVSRPIFTQPFFSQNPLFRALCPEFDLLMHFRGTYHWGERPRTVPGWGSLAWRFQKWCQEVNSDLGGQIWGRAWRSPFDRFQRVEIGHKKCGQTWTIDIRF